MGFANARLRSPVKSGRITHAGHLMMVLFVLSVMAFGSREAVALVFDPTASFFYQRLAGQVAPPAGMSNLQVEAALDDSQE